MTPNSPAMTSNGAPKAARSVPLTPEPPPAKPTELPAVSTGREELELLIRARYPVVYVVSWEEARVEAHLREIAKRRSKQLHVWTVTSGLRDATSGNSAASVGPKGKQVLDPVDALNVVMEHKDPAIYLFHDLNPFLRPEHPCNRATIRKVRDVARALADSYKTLVICSPLMEFAPELQKDITVVDYPLPGAAEIGGLLDKIIDDVAEHASLKVDLDDAGREGLIRAAGGLTLQEAENVLAKTLVNDGTLDGKDVSTVFAEKQQIIKKSGLLEYCETSDGLDDVGGLSELKAWLVRRSLAFSEKARTFGLPAPKGVLLVGVQGCGKSLCAKAVSRAWNMPLLRFDMGRMFSSLVGSSEQNIRRAIAVAESIAPAILWVDEIDKAFAGSTGSAGADGGTSARVMSTFLTWLSEKDKPVFVLATANDISHLPPELLRKGRLDEIFFVDLPSLAERRRIFEIHVRKRGRDAADIDVDRLARAADGFSGAEIEQAVISALYDVFYRGAELRTADVEKSLAETVPLSRTMSERIGSLRQWAEGRARFASPKVQTQEPAPEVMGGRKLEL